MNYRHAFHAGNFADVIKHAILARVLTHLAEKPAPYRVIDTHAGAGLTDLEGEEAQRTGEWRDGIARLAAADLPPAAAALIAPYLDAVRAHNAPGGVLRRYPGSPAIALSLMRDTDRLVANELEPGTAAALSALLRRERRARVLTLDAWTALNAQVPPPERRGVVLIDPPFEQPDEFPRMAEALASAHRKWPTGIYLLWYPIKNTTEVNAFVKALTRLALPKTLRIELMLEATEATRLRGSGLIAINPPWRLHDELKHMLPALGHALARSAAFTQRLEWLVEESRD